MTMNFFDKRPVSMQEIADAHDTCTFVLAPSLSDRTTSCNPTVRLVEMLPHPFVECDKGAAHWTDPTVPVYPWLPHYWENRFRFEATANFKVAAMRGHASALRGQRIEAAPARPMPETEIIRRLKDIASSATGAGAKNVVIDWMRRVVTGDYLYLPDHPVVGWVRSFGVMPYEVDGKSVPAPGTPYPHKTPVAYIPEDHPAYIRHLLTWEDGSSFALTEKKARDTVAAWRTHGMVTGTLDDHTLAYQDNFGRRATITRYTGQQHRLDSIDPVTGGIR